MYSHQNIIFVDVLSFKRNNNNNNNNNNDDNNNTN